MLGRVLNFSGVVPIAGTMTLVQQITGSRSWRIATLRIVFLPGQAGTLFVRPQARDISGARNDIFQPDPEITGDDWVSELHDVPFDFIPGTAIQIELRNTAARHTRRYAIQIVLHEIGGSIV